MDAITVCLKFSDFQKKEWCIKGKIRLCIEENVLQQSDEANK
jgi:hypothetical protein